MGLGTIINGQGVELGTTNPNGLAIGKINPHRKLIQWNVPTRGVVEMYINPQSLSITERKLIKETRTKGGFIIQYWGESLPEIDINGTTGSGGVEGINVLRDVYRQEQIGFNDIISQLNSGFLNNLFQTTLGAIQNLSNNPLITAVSSAVSNLSSLSTPNSPSQFFSDVSTVVGNVANVFDAIGRSITSDQTLIPTLAALATSVDMIYDGKTYHGFFKEFRVDEKADELGIMRYSMKFTVTRQTGIRSNDFAWQRSVNNGPANSDVVPFSFGALAVPNSTSIATPTTTQTTTPSGVGVSRRSLLTG